MQGEQKIFMIIGVAATIAILALLYGTISIQSTAEKIEARGLLLSGLAEKNLQTVSGQSEPGSVEITMVSINYSPEKNLVSLSSFPLQLRQIPGVKIIAEKNIEKDSKEAEQLIKQYQIERIPTILLQGQTKKSEFLMQNWPQIGTIESDGTMVLRNIPPVYFEISTGKLRGETKVVFVSVPDKNGVFDAGEVFRQILQNAFGVWPVEEKTISYNSPEGNELLEKYGLEKLPTFIISGDLKAYQGFPDAWKQVGSVEQDESFVFRELGVLGGLKYLDLNKNEVVETPQQVQ